MNLGRSKIISFKLPTFFSVSIDGKELETVKETLYLGQLISLKNKNHKKK